MKLWNTQEIIKRLVAIAQVKSATVSAEGEDHTTQQIRVEVHGTTECAYIRGFSTGSTLSAGDNILVEMVEVTTDYSNGTLPDDVAFLIAYGWIRAAVVSVGHRVVNSLEDYF